MSQNPTWAINDWDKQDNQWGREGLVYMVPESAPLKDQISFAEGSADVLNGLVAKKKGKEKAKYQYKARIAWDHVAALKRKAAPPPPPAKKPAAPAKPMNDEAIKNKAFGTEAQQAATEKTENRKEAFDKTVQGITMAKDAKDLVKTLRTPVAGLAKGGGLIEARDGGGFGDLQQIVKLALAKTPKQAYEVALARREIYLRVNIVNEAAAKIVHTATHFPMSAGRCTGLPELGPFMLQPIDPRNKQGSFALLGGSSGDGFFRKLLVSGRFIRAAITFCAETPDKKAHMDFTVGFNWEPNGPSGVSVLLGTQLEPAFQKAKNPQAELTSGGLRVLVAINNQVVVIAVGRV